MKKIVARKFPLEAKTAKSEIPTPIKSDDEKTKIAVKTINIKIARGSKSFEASRYFFANAVKLLRFFSSKFTKLFSSIFSPDFLYILSSSGIDPEIYFCKQIIGSSPIMTPAIFPRHFQEARKLAPTIQYSLLTIQSQGLALLTSFVLLAPLAFFTLRVKNTKTRSNYSIFIINYLLLSFPLRARSI